MEGGETLHEIGRYLAGHMAHSQVLMPRGGIAPVACRRSRLRSPLEEREDISRGVTSGSSIREIAPTPQSIRLYGEPGNLRHGGRPAYRAYDADQRAWMDSVAAERCLLAGNRELRDMVVSKLTLDRSPEQIPGG